MNRPLVGIFVDGSNTYGRAILRGTARYANLQRRWLLFKDLECVMEPGGAWPTFDGAIFAGPKLDVVASARKFCRHMVNCSGAGDPDVCPVVALDDVAAGTQAAEHSMDCHLERFAFHSPRPAYPVATRRLDGFRAALGKRGYKCVESPIPRPTAPERLSHAHRPALIRWLRTLPKPIGIFAFDDTTAHDLAEACLEADIGVPDHVAIIGVNNDDLLCETAWPPLSSVDADYTRVG